MRRYRHSEPVENGEDLGSTPMGVRVCMRMSRAQQGKLGVDSRMPDVNIVNVQMWEGYAKTT